MRFVIVLNKRIWWWLHSATKHDTKYGATQNYKLWVKLLINELTTNTVLLISEANYSCWYSVAGVEGFRQRRTAPADTASGSVDGSSQTSLRRQFAWRRSACTAGAVQEIQRDDVEPWQRWWQCQRSAVVQARTHQRHLQPPACLCPPHGTRWSSVFDERRLWRPRRARSWSTVAG